MARSYRISDFVTFLAAVALATFDSTAVASEMGHVAGDQVSLDSYKNFLDQWLYTHTGHSRGKWGAQHDPARDNIKALFESYGLATKFEPFSYSGGTYENVVATLVGKVYPERIYIVGGHYDSADNPGADDNASGVALVLEVARILSQYESDCTLRFIAFDMEEEGLIGSSYYVDTHKGEDIRGMISTDMVAYDPDTNHANIYGRTSSTTIKSKLAAAVTEYGSGLTYTIGPDTPYSNHAPFEEAGYQACLFIEGEVWSNPYYHTQQDCFDTPGYLNFGYAVKMVRSVVGYLVDAAGVAVNLDTLKFSYPDGRPEFSSPAGGTRVRVEVSGLGGAVPKPGTGKLYYNVGAGWQTALMEIVADNVYDAVLPAAACGTQVLYYVSAESTTGEVFTDPHGAPTGTYWTIAAYGRTDYFQNTLDANPGWPVQGQWAFGQPTGQGGSSYGYPDPKSGYSGTNVYGVNLEGDYSTTIGGPHYLTVGPLDLSNAMETGLRFQRWLNTDYQPYVYATIHVSKDGSAWTEVWNNGKDEIAENSWSTQEYDISATADQQPKVYLRWGYQIGSGAFAYSGWNVDDITITALQCQPTYAAGDLNCDEKIDAFDIDPFVLALTDPAGYAAAYPNCDRMLADINDDGKVDAFDIDPFVDLLTGR